MHCRRRPFETLDTRECHHRAALAVHPGLLDHPGHRGLGDQERAGEVDGDHSLPLGAVEQMDRPAGCGTSGVNDPVESTWYRRECGHDRGFVGLSFLLLVAQGFGMGAVVDATRVEGRHARLDVVAAEEVAIVIEDELVIIGVAMEKWHAHGVLVLLQPTADVDQFQNGTMSARDPLLADQAVLGIVVCCFERIAAKFA